MELTKAVNSVNSRPKLDRGNSLSIKQYNLIYNFLRNGDKPTLREMYDAEFAAASLKPDHVRQERPYARFKSIAKRLRITHDNQLVFKTNNKIVLPINNFKNAIMEAHQNEGKRHLSLTRTIEKLSEKYTMGCRQFGISEDIVRVVVKKCQSGSCVKKQALKHHTEDNTAPDVQTVQGTLSEAPNFVPPAASQNQGQPIMTASYNNPPHMGLPVPSPANNIPFAIQPVQMVPLANGGFALRPLSFLMGTNVMMPFSMMRPNMRSPPFSCEQPLDLRKDASSPGDNKSNKNSGQVSLELRMPYLGKILAMPFLHQISPQGNLNPEQSSECTLTPKTKPLSGVSANGNESSTPNSLVVPLCNSYVDINNNISVLGDHNVTVRNQQPAIVMETCEQMDDATPPILNISG
ncbi:uncharacterized protein LOC127845936 [Dreissena polymorpha]|uniref:uncharacterized protein LOC127845936 n=1 Tax=Dreissena polymorpha TaxID=45954 RepID=UPI002264ABD5|nr:uncharacterized protein LOC127845936 [Dreissena polymorpha]